MDNLNRQFNEICAESVFTAIIPTNIYGRNDNFSLEQSHVVPGLIHKAYLSVVEAQRAGLESAKLKVCGTGKPLRQFIYAPDLARIILWAVEEYADTEALICCPDEKDEISIGRTAEIICDIFSDRFNIRLEVEFDVDQSDGQLKKTASNCKLRRLLPDFTFTSFEVGLRQSIDWFCQNYPNLRGAQEKNHVQN